MRNPLNMTFKAGIAHRDTHTKQSNCNLERFQSNCDIALFYYIKKEKRTKNRKTPSTANT